VLSVTTRVGGSIKAPASCIRCPFFDCIASSAHPWQTTRSRPRAARTGVTDCPRMQTGRHFDCIDDELQVKDAVPTRLLSLSIAVALCLQGFREAMFVGARPGLRAGFRVSLCVKPEACQADALIPGTETRHTAYFTAAPSSATCRFISRSVGYTIALIDFHDASRSTQETPSEWQERVREPTRVEMLRPRRRAEAATLDASKQDATHYRLTIL